MKIDFGSEEASELIKRAITRGVRKALWQHKRMGNPVAVSDAEGNLKILQPEEIEIPDEFDERSTDAKLVNRLTNDYCVNASMVYDLTDAKEEIESVLELFNPNESVDESEFRTRMAHLYYYLNSAWNKRNLSDEELAQLDGKGTNRLAHFPLDITPL